MRQETDLTQVTGGLYTPVVTRERFAELVGLPTGVVLAQCDKGYWPTYRVGKRVFVNLEAVRLRAGDAA